MRPGGTPLASIVSQYPRIRAASSDFPFFPCPFWAPLVSIPSHSGSLFGPDKPTAMRHRLASSQYPRIRAASSDPIRLRSRRVVGGVSIPSHSGSLFGRPVVKTTHICSLVSIPSHSGSLFGLPIRLSSGRSSRSQYPRIRAASSDPADRSEVQARAARLNTLAFGQPLRTGCETTLTACTAESQYPRIRAASSDIAPYCQMGSKYASQYPRIRAASSDTRPRGSRAWTTLVSIPSHSGSLFGR